MTFSSPENFAYFGLLLIVPLLYLVRRRSRLAPVPHLFLWERALATQGRSRRSRIHDLLGLILNLLILSALILITTGPQAEVHERAQRATLIVLDGSLSMTARDAAGTTRNARSREAARAELEDLSADGPLGLAIVGEELQLPHPLGSEAAAIAESLDVELDCRGAFDAAVLAQLVRRQRERSPDLRVILFSDAAFDAGDLDLVQERIELRRIGGDERNAAIIACSLREREGDGFLIEVDLAASGGAMEAEIVVTTADGRTTREPLSLEANATRRLALRGQQAKAGFVAIELRAEGDAIPSDDRLEFHLDRDPRLRVLAVADELGEPLTAALAALDDVFDPAQSGRARARDWRRADLATYDLVLLRGLEEKRPLPAGRYILIASSAPGLPLAIEGLSKEPEVLRQAHVPQLLRGLDLRDLDIGEAQLVRARKGLDVLLESESGVLLSRGGAEDLAFIHLAIDADEKASSLVLLPAFPLLLKDAALSLVPARPRYLPRVLPAGARVEPAAALPAGAGVREIPADPGEIAPELLDGQGLVHVPRRLGRARFLVGDREEEAGLAVLDAAASDLRGRPISGAAIAGKPDLVAREESLADRLLMLALGLLVLEWLLFTRGLSR